MICCENVVNVALFLSKIGETSNLIKSQRWSYSDMHILSINFQVQPSNYTQPFCFEIHRATMVYPHIFTIKRKKHKAA